MKKTNSKGFTLIELLIVVVIIGILAAVAVPKFSSTKEKAHLASAKTDLRNLATAMEGLAADNGGKYKTPASGSDYQESPGITITPAVTDTSWYATAVHAQVKGTTCGIYVNGAKPASMPTTTKEGEVACW